MTFGAGVDDEQISAKNRRRRTAILMACFADAGVPKLPSLEIEREDAGLAEEGEDAFAMPDMNCKSPVAYGGSPVSFYVYVENVDAAFRRAVDAGGKALMPVADMFWGDRIGPVIDPFGHKWTLAQHVSDPTMEEMKKGQEAFMAQMQKQKK
jgi:hypothetical protein